jgi:hypothetical protein
MADPLPDLLVSVDLDPSDREFRLPGAGSRSLILVFDGQQIGAQIVTADGRDLTPGSHHDRAHVRFWAEGVAMSFRVGGAFDLWYSGIVGRGTVTSVVERPQT